MELESLGGSGLFPAAAILEHSCLPTLSFTTHESKVFVTCIRLCAAGERLSIDYGNLHYRPTSERRNYTLEKYGFVCSCERCRDQPDYTRAFRCPNPSCAGKQGALVYPAALGREDSDASKPRAIEVGGAENMSHSEADAPSVDHAAWTACPSCGRTPDAHQVLGEQLSATQRICRHVVLTLQRVSPCRRLRCGAKQKLN